MNKPLKKMYKAGFTEKQMKLTDGTVLNYGEGSSNGKTPLLLIHGQGMTWEDYSKVLPALSCLCGGLSWAWKIRLES